jgi:hypothetical protein
MQSVSESIGEKKFSDQHLGFGVFPFNAAHIVTAGFWIVNICHNVKVYKSFFMQTRRKYFPKLTPRYTVQPASAQ